VSKIQAVGGTIAEINSISDEIVTPVEQLATREISSNVRPPAAHGTSTTASSASRRTSGGPGGFQSIRSRQRLSSQS
jgi:methyl-accepting chemotaxis protein